MIEHTTDTPEDTTRDDTWRKAYLKIYIYITTSTNDTHTHRLCIRLKLFTADTTNNKIKKPRQGGNLANIIISSTRVHQIGMCVCSYQSVDVSLMNMSLIRFPVWLYFANLYLFIVAIIWNYISTYVVVIYIGHNLFMANTHTHPRRVKSHTSTLTCEQSKE